MSMPEAGTPPASWSDRPGQGIILVTGASGYIASKLIPRLLDEGYTVRCLARNPQSLASRDWFPEIQVLQADVTRPETLADAMRGVTSAYYLVHSMSAGRGYDRLDLASARNFSRAAGDAGVKHIIYLGGLADPDDPGLSRHMRSRIETGDALREGSVPVTEFRAGVIVGPGSVSFEMIRFIAEQFPLLLGPAWLRHRSQPVSTPNVLDFLLAALRTPAAVGRIFEIGSPESYNYLEIIQRYAQIRGHNRAALLLPYMPVGLLAVMIDWLTPVQRSYAHPLVEGLQNDSLVRDRSGLLLFPGIQLMDYPAAVKRALQDTNPALVERTWLDENTPKAHLKHEGMLIDYRRHFLPIPKEVLMQRLEALTRQRKQFHLGLISTFQQDYHSETVMRVMAAEKIPGRAWLEWKLTPQTGGTLLEQTIFFAPHGLPAFLAWYLLRPLNRIHFHQLLRRLSGRS